MRPAPFPLPLIYYGSRRHDQWYVLGAIPEKDRRPISDSCHQSRRTNGRGTQRSRSRARRQGAALEDAKAKKAESEKQQRRAESEQRIAEAVKDFLQNKLLAQADINKQANSLLEAGGEASETKRNPTIRELLDRAAEELSSDKIEQSFPNQPLVQAEILATVGGTYGGIGELTPAIDFLKRADALYKQCLGPEHPRTLVTTNSLAWAYLNAGKLGTGQSLYAETLKLSNSKFGQDHPVTLSSMAGLAHADPGAGKLDLAIPLYEKTLELEKTNLGHDHPNTLVTLNNLAVAYQFAHKMDLALPLLEESLKLTEATIWPRTSQHDRVDEQP